MLLLLLLVLVLVLLLFAALAATAWTCCWRSTLQRSSRRRAVAMSGECLASPNSSLTLQLAAAQAECCCQLKFEWRWGSHHHCQDIRQQQANVPS
jgi:hypothetical protein